jgi:hypothetical protein
MGGSLEYKEISDFVGMDIYKNIKNFVETGTYKAETTLMAAKKFDNVYTTEIVPDLHNESKSKAISSNVKNITFLLGDSVELLKNIVPKVLEGAVFFLDAHQSGCDTSNNGKNHVPLFQELDVILGTYNGKKVGPSIYIIDDLRLFSKFWDWEGISTQTIIKKFKEHGHSVDCFFSQQDRFYVLTK